jgi:hypothetical protein
MFVEISVGKWRVLKRTVLSLAALLIVRLVGGDLFGNNLFTVLSGILII